MKSVSWLWQPPQLNPENGKALTIPILNPYDLYGRVFHLSWIGFFVAFLSWFAFPPLMADISKDLHLTPAQVSDSNIVALCSTLLARFVLGPMCDRFGPRWTMAGTLFIGAVPTAFVPLVNNVQGLYAIRFFIGLLGGVFIPCQYWTTVFFDKTIVGRANALAGGWGNAGGGVAFFSMTAVVNSLQRRGYSLHDAWHYSFVVYPFIVIMVVAALIVLLGADCPEGRWSERASLVTTLEAEGVDAEVVDEYRRKLGGASHRTPSPDAETSDREQYPDKFVAPHPSVGFSASLVEPTTSGILPVLSRMSQAGSRIGAHKGEVTVTDPNETIENPTIWSVLRTTFSPPTMLNSLAYASTFGGELAVESIVSALYAAHAAKLGTPWTAQHAGNWGSMLGLLNVVTRPCGGYISDLLYARWKTPLVKKYWMLLCGFLMGVFLLYMGLYKHISMAGLIVSMAFMSLFMEMGNGANFSLVPHTNPHHTGIVAGTTGAFGNIGGVLFSLAFRFAVLPSGKTDYQSALWYIAIAVMSINALLVFVPLAKL